MTLPPVLTVTDLTRSFPVPGRRGEAVHALTGVSFSLPAGSFTAVVGASGSGKSTLLHCVAGLDRPTSGTVRMLGADTTALKPKPLAAFRARNVGFVFQEYNLVSSLTAAENVALPARLAGHPVKDADLRAALDAVQLSHRAGSLPHLLSGGERQRVAVARVMATAPRIVFADEPTGALDVESAGLVLDWLGRIAAGGATVLMVTHDTAAAARADQVLVMHAGRLAAHLPGGDERAVEAALREVRTWPMTGPASVIGHDPRAVREETAR